MAYVEIEKLTCCGDQMVYIKERREAICVWCDLIKEDIQDIREWYNSQEYHDQHWDGV